MFDACEIKTNFAKPQENIPEAEHNNKVMMEQVFLKKTEDGRINTCAYAYGSLQKDYTRCNEAASSTMTPELHLILAAINAKQ
jgi:type IV secretory pathway VirB9-like protein